MSFTPFNAPLLSGLLGDMEVASLFSVKADLDAMLRFEVELAHAEAEAGVIPADAAAQIAEAAKTFEPDVRALGEATTRDGMAVPEFVRQLRSAVDAPADQYVHFGATSQDVIDTSLVLRLKGANKILLNKLEAVVARLDALTTQFGDRDLLARTRMQVALPIKVADRLELWSAPLRHQRAEHSVLEPRVMRVQFGGPVGTLDKLGGRGSAVRAALAERLNLAAPDSAWHTDRSSLAAYTNWLTQLANALGKIGTDFTLMAQDEIAAVQHTGGGGSSAMAHKQNPIKAEALVTLARFVGAMASGMNAAAIHEQERSGASWTLEWMLVPQMVVATGAALRNAQELLSSIESLGDRVNGEG